MEQIVFPVPGICQFLTEETKHRLFTTTEQDEQAPEITETDTALCNVDFDNK